MKQYVVKEAYTGNYHVIEVVNGRIELNSIVAYYELSGYINSLKNRGYTEAYYVPEYEAAMKKAEEKYEFAKKEFEQAKENSLMLSIGEIDKYRKITFST